MNLLVLRNCILKDRVTVYLSLGITVSWYKIIQKRWKYGIIKRKIFFNLQHIYFRYFFLILLYNRDSKNDIK